MSAAVVFHSKTGHSRKIARAIARVLGQDSLDISQWKPGRRASLLFLVSGIYGGKSAKELLDFVGGLSPGDIGRVVLLCSCASAREEQNDLKQALAAAGIPLHPQRFLCPGSFLFFRMGRPNQEDLDRAVDFAQRLAAQQGSN